MLDSYNIILFLIIVVTIPLYFLPSIIGRKKTFIKQLFVLNLFLGCTFIGWVIALVWSLKNETPGRVEKNINDYTLATIEKLNQLRKDGVITEEEFSIQKHKLLNQ
jgi:hypothetical protein